ncbi:NAD(P)/FAD-dependent oxidoreductase [Methanolapillus ohkumae]|uniref:NAD(P)/FAD-dependent oxidoreductase n=1 Tax=Methanolapillus ohkumae TaxID=3028298 RepID=A0AA96V8E8_9EURY|nr:hypothetical protein MsAm2_09740 [Methanosarcinaceae archaeon Am2]
MDSALENYDTTATAPTATAPTATAPIATAPLPTNNNCFDVIVIGGGPSGSIAARYAKLNGASGVLMIEENSSIGIPVQCAGLLSVAAVREAEIEPDDSFVLHSVSGADVYPPSEKFLPVRGKSTMAYVVSRSAFDQKSAKKAKEAGVEIWLKTKAIGMKRGPDPRKRIKIQNNEPDEKGTDEDKTGTNREKIEITPPKNQAAGSGPIIDAEFEEQDGWILTVAGNGIIKTLFAKMIIAADGANGRAAGWAGLSPCEKLLSGIQVDVEYDSKNPGAVEVFVGSAAPGFFAWTIPISDSVSRIGLAIDKEAAEKYNPISPQTAGKKVNAHSYLMEFLKRPEIASKIQSEPSNLTAGNIPLGPMKKTYATGFLVVGDAAGQCKPISGGGIYPGAVAAKIAGKVAGQAVVENNFSEKKMAEYEKQWKTELQKELDIGMLAHKYRTKMSDADMDGIFKEMNNPEMLAMITEYGDMDHPSILIRKIMFSKQAFKMMKLMKVFLKNLV